MFMHDPCDPIGCCDAHHAGRRGLGQRAHDNTAIPLCRKHHMNWHDASGVFRSWKKDERRAWAGKQIRRMRLCWHRYLRADV